MDPLKKDPTEGLGDDKQTPGQQDDSGSGGNHDLDTEGLTERQVNQIAGLKNALNSRDADISLIGTHGLRFMADKNYLADLDEATGRKLIDRLKREKSISIDMEYDDIIADLNNGGNSGVDPNKVADIAVKRMQAIQESKETDIIVSQALGEIEDVELKKRFQEDYKELSGGKKLTPALAKKLSDTILKGYRADIQAQRMIRDRTLGAGSSGVAGTRIGSDTSNNSSRKNYEQCLALGWDDIQLAKYYPEFHKPKQ